ncbi:MAG: DUF536 domain-containing protein [SAR324 cluster bacterium]|nr:DUF536 domain-containing protein [SAR324 cluster bacterium]
MYTLGQAAREVGIKRQSLTRWIEKLSIQTREEGQARFISEADLHRIQKEREVSQSRQTETRSSPKHAFVSQLPQDSRQEREVLIHELQFLRSQLTAKDEQLESAAKHHAEHLTLLKGQVEIERLRASAQLRKKDEQIGMLQKTLDQEQQLHAGTMTQVANGQAPN